MELKGNEIREKIEELLGTYGEEEDSLKRITKVKNEGKVFNIDFEYIKNDGSESTGSASIYTDGKLREFNL